MKKIGLLAAALCLFSADAGAAFVSPYVGADYNYSSLNFGRESEDFYADNFNSLGVVAGVKLLSFLSVEGFYQQSENKDNTVRNHFVEGDEFSTKLKLKSYGVDLVGDVLNLGIVEILSSVGYGYYDADVTNTVNINGVGGRRSFNEEGNGFRLGIGGQINPLPSLGIRAMFRYTVTDMDAVKNMKEVTVGVRYYF
ncbi:MAG: outer membrane beta-barrel protein [Alphaproteobacteria bacterium]